MQNGKLRTIEYNKVASIPQRQRLGWCNGQICKHSIGQECRAVKYVLLKLTALMDSIVHPGSKMKNSTVAKPMISTGLILALITS